MAGDDETGSPATVAEGSARRSQRALTEIELSRGTVIGRYIIVERLGEGGMGVVYTAFDPDLNRKVALKLVTHGDQARVLREAQALARLSHPNVVTIHDVGSVGERVFMAMELVEGETVSQWLRAGKRTWREIARVFVAAGRGLAAAHAADIVHRDVKPGNVVVGRDGRVRVLDFGLARAAGDTASPPSSLGDSPGRDALNEDLTATGGVLGTPVYMAPEAFRGELVGEAGDQFSFCVALFEALYGIRPYEGNWLDAADPPALRSPPENHRVPAWLNKVVVRGLAAKPADRYPTMDALLDALQADPAARRRKVLIAAGAAIAVAAVVFAAIAWRTQARVAPHPCDQPVPFAGVWDPDVRERVHRAFTASGVPEAEAHWTRTAAVLDASAGDWLSARAQVCAKRDEPEAQLFRLGCLDRQKQDLTALIALFQKPGGISIDKAARAVHELPAPLVCANAMSLSLVAPPPPALRERALALQQRMSEFHALRIAGHTQQADVALAALIHDARELGYAPLVAEAILQQGELESHHAQADAAVRDLEEALSIANASHADAIAARAAASLASARNQRASDRALIEPAVSNARAWIARTGDLEASFRLEVALYQAAMNVGHYDDALEHTRNAQRLAKQLYGPQSYSLLANQGNEGLVLGQLGLHDKAIDVMKQAIRGEEETLGHDHPEMAADLDNLAVSLVAVGRTDEARATIERALALPVLDAVLHAALGCDMCRTLVAAGQPAEAIHWGQECLDKLGELKVGPLNLVINEDPLAMAYLGAKKYKQALALARKCLADFRAERAADSVDMVPCLAVEGTALLELGNAKLAVASLDKTLALQDKQPAAPGVVANLRFQLARALVATGGDRARARELAEQARTELVRYPFEKPLLDSLDAWRARSLSAKR